MTGWERLGIGGLSQGFLSGWLSPSAALDDALAGIAAIDDDLAMPGSQPCALAGLTVAQCEPRSHTRRRHPAGVTVALT